MAEYPKWHLTAAGSPMQLIQHEIDALRARLDAAGIAKVEVCDDVTPCDGSGSEKYGASDWTQAGQDASGFPVEKGSPEDVTSKTSEDLIPDGADEHTEG